MIVTSVESGWEIVFQETHGLLAAQLAQKLKKRWRPREWTQTVAAILTHDDHKQPFNARHYVTKLGAPRDFTLVSMSAAERLAEAERRIAHSTRKHRWIGLLMSRHVEHLYGGESGVSAKMKRLLRNEQKRRKATLQAIGLGEAELEHAYSLLQWCDRCSLILTRGEIPAMERRIEITHTLDDKRSYLKQRSDGTLAVKPWPFEEDELTVSAEVRLLEQLAFSDDEDLIKRLDAAQVETRQWTFSRND
ncbi:MAG: DUF3891 family protein [Planctomycetales bacterium]|nr:DUF3891 family protein [Planctomycetales bacterium]